MKATINAAVKKKIHNKERCREQKRYLYACIDIAKKLSDSASKSRKDRDK